MTKVFISYARDGSHGQNLAAEAQERLQAAGFEVFRDVIGLKPGESFPHRLEFELESSDAMVLVISEKVRRSEWVYNEFSLAKQLGMQIIPVLAEQMRLPLWLQNAHCLDFCSGSNWQRLLAPLGVKHPQSLSLTERGAKEQWHRLPLTPLPGGGARVAPSWGSHSDQDQFGYYADLTIKNIIQRFRWVEPGTFNMGSPKSEEGRYNNEVLHQVILTKGFWLADTTCTQGFWQIITGRNPAYFKVDPDCPVEQVSWNDLQKFIQVFNHQQPGLNVRLPSEAEWEYACRAGTEMAFSFGGKFDLSTEKVNYSGEWDDWNPKGETEPVKSYQPNGWGFYEMHGNVWEWCQDEWQEQFPATTAIDPLVEPVSNQGQRVARGGSWFRDGMLCRSAYRLRRASDQRNDDLGFRLALGA